MRFARSDDRGATGPIENASVVISIPGNGSTTQHASIDADGSGAGTTKVHIGFHDGNFTNLKAIVSRDNGATWGR